MKPSKPSVANCSRPNSAGLGDLREGSNEVLSTTVLYQTKWNLAGGLGPDFVAASSGFASRGYRNGFERNSAMSSYYRAVSVVLLRSVAKGLSQGNYNARGQPDSHKRERIDEPRNQSNVACRRVLLRCSQM